MRNAHVVNALHLKAFLKSLLNVVVGAWQPLRERRDGIARLVDTVGVKCGIYGGSYGEYMHKLCCASKSSPLSARLASSTTVRCRSSRETAYSYEDENFLNRRAMALSDIELAQIMLQLLINAQVREEYTLLSMPPRDVGLFGVDLSNAYAHRMHDNACPVSHSQIAIRKLRATCVSCEMFL